MRRTRVSFDAFCEHKGDALIQRILWDSLDGITAVLPGIQDTEADFQFTFGVASKKQQTLFS